MNDSSPQLPDNQTETIVGAGDPKPSRSSKRSLWLFGAVVIVAILISVGFLVFRPSKQPTEGPVGNTASLSNLTPAQITITKTGFVPSTISVRVGQAVAWTNNDRAPHLVASDPYPNDNTLPGLNSRQIITQNDRYSYVFDKSGTYTYHDNLNPSLHGTVIVR